MCSNRTQNPFVEKDCKIQILIRNIYIYIYKVKIEFYSIYK